MNTLLSMRYFSDSKVESINYQTGTFTYHSGGKRTLRKGNIESVVKNRPLLLSFDKQSIASLVAAYKAKNAKDMGDTGLIRPTTAPHQNWLLFLMGLYITVFISTNIFAGRFIHVLGMTLPGGIYGFPLTFAILDIVTEYFGLATARRVIASGLLCLYSFVGLVYLYYYWGPLYITPQNTETANLIDHALYQVFFYKDNILMITISGSVAIALSDTFNCYLMSYFKRIQKERHLWLRCLAATFIAEAVFSVTWLTIYSFKTGYLPTSQILWTSVSQTFVKSMYEVFMLPATYLIIFWFKFKDNGHDPKIIKPIRE